MGASSVGGSQHWHAARCFERDECKEVLSDAVRFEILQLFFVYAKEEESLRDEIALAKGERIKYQETMMILCLLC